MTSTSSRPRSPTSKSGNGLWYAHTRAPCTHTQTCVWVHRGLGTPELLSLYRCFATLTSTGVRTREARHTGGFGEREGIGNADGKWHMF